MSDDISGRWAFFRDLAGSVDCHTPYMRDLIRIAFQQAQVNEPFDPDEFLRAIERHAEDSET